MTVEADSASAGLSFSEPLSHFFDFAKCRFLPRNVSNDFLQLEYSNTFGFFECC